MNRRKFLAVAPAACLAASLPASAQAVNMQAIYRLGMAAGVAQCVINIHLLSADGRLPADFLPSLQAALGQREP